jgi:hypothetical protein
MKFWIPQSALCWSRTRGCYREDDCTLTCKSSFIHSSRMVSCFFVLAEQSFYQWVSAQPGALTGSDVFKVIPDHQLLDSAPNLGPLISRWEINKFKNCRYKSVRILEVLKLLFQQFLNLSRSQRDMSGPILGSLSNYRWSGGTTRKLKMVNVFRNHTLFFFFFQNQRSTFYI